MSKRKHISLETKLAAALLMLRDGSGELLIQYEHGQLMTANQICSLFQWDHWPIRHEDGGPNEPWNLTPRLIQDHRRKTAKIDAPEAAKGRRIRESVRQHVARLLAKVDADTPRIKIPERYGYKRKIPSRPFPKSQRSMRSKRR